MKFIAYVSTESTLLIIPLNGIKGMKFNAKSNLLRLFFEKDKKDFVMTEANFAEFKKWLCSNETQEVFDLTLFK